MNHLRRELAPITEAAWAQIDEEATRSLKLSLAARRMVDVAPALGWSADAVATGAIQPLTSAGQDGVEAAVRVPLPLLELRTPFTLSLADLDSADRGNPAIDTDPVVAAARRAAAAEDTMVFAGLEGAPFAGVIPSSTHEPIQLGDDVTDYPEKVAHAVAVLRKAGVGGPFAVALGDEEYTGVAETTEHGYPILEHLQRLLGGEVVWAPALSGGVVLSCRGGDFSLVLGQDYAIGYAGHERDAVHLYLEESVAFTILTPSAAVQGVEAEQPGPVAPQHRARIQSSPSPSRASAAIWWA